MDVTEKSDGGVVKEIIKEGIGGDDELPLHGDKVCVHYVGTLENGTKFDSSRDRGEKFEFTLGKGEVIKAWELGVATMKIGEVCKLTCKSEYAYGPRGSPPKIPPNATLIFEVELFGWRGEDLTTDKDGGIIRRILSQGEGYYNPNDGALVKVSLVGRHSSNGGSSFSVFDERDLTFTLGEGSEHNVPEGLEKALERFKAKEKSKIKLTPQYAFGAEGNSDLGVPPNAQVEYEVLLKEFTKAKETWEMDQEEKLQQAALFKDKGTEYFKKRKYSQALKFYKKILDYLQFNSGLSEELKKEFTSTKLSAHLNVTLCQLKLEDFQAAKDHASKAIEIDPHNVKAYFRRGQAYLKLEYAEEAKNDFSKCLCLEPSNKAASQQLQICFTKIKNQTMRERRLYGGMFEKFARTDNKKNPSIHNNNNSDVMSGDLGEWDSVKETAAAAASAGENAESDDFASKMKASDVQNLNNVEMI